MLKIKCLKDIEKLKKEHTLPSELTDFLLHDLHSVHRWADYDHLYDFETYHTDMTDNGYIAILDGTENKEELEQEIGLTGGYENTIPEAVNLHKFGPDKWCRVLVIYNDSYAMILWIKNYDNFDDYADEPAEQEEKR